MAEKRSGRTRTVGGRGPIWVLAALYLLYLDYALWNEIHRAGSEMNVTLVLVLMVVFLAAALAILAWVFVQWRRSQRGGASSPCADADTTQDRGQ